ncbi:hypothetical protein KKC60_04125 [Patescibacteria group bacterium]|nr:hypothetical protein [Patescibacteria group bacterium]
MDRGESGSHPAPKETQGFDSKSPERVSSRVEYNPDWEEQAPNEKGQIFVNYKEPSNRWRDMDPVKYRDLVIESNTKTEEMRTKMEQLLMIYANASKRGDSETSAAILGELDQLREKASTAYQIAPDPPRSHSPGKRTWFLGTEIESHMRQIAANEGLDIKKKRKGLSPEDLKRSETEALDTLKDLRKEYESFATTLVDLGIDPDGGTVYQDLYTMLVKDKDKKNPVWQKIPISEEDKNHVFQKQAAKVAGKYDHKFFDIKRKKINQEQLVSQISEQLLLSEQK